MNINTKRLKEIIDTYADPWKDLSQFRELLQDYFPDDKICRNLLYISAEERIPQKLRRSHSCEEDEIDFQIQRLMDASGCTKRNADKILNMWVEVFEIEVSPVELEPLMGLPAPSESEMDDSREPVCDGGAGVRFEDYVSDAEEPPITDTESPYTEFDHPGRDVCDLLRDVRKKIAEKNGIKYEFEECHHTGPCKGTCPACEAELRYLEAELKKKIDRGEKVFIDGLASPELEEYIKNNEKKIPEMEVEHISMGRYVPPSKKNRKDSKNTKYY